MEEFEGTEVRCSAVVFKGRDILLVRRAAAGDWVLPGGIPRPGESMAACARRETAEETGLAIEPDRIAFVLESLGRARTCAPWTWSSWPGCRQVSRSLGWPNRG